jgi:hypothetical protein
MPMKRDEIVDFRIGERLYTFPNFDEACKAIAIHCRFVGTQDQLEIAMKEKGVSFSKSPLENANPDYQLPPRIDISLQLLLNSSLAHI